MPITNNVILANSSGSVGIGTYSPTVKLDVSGSAKFTVGVNGTVDITNSGAITLRNQIGAEGRFGTFSNHDLVLTTNNTSRLTIAAAGNVGINTTSATLATLQVQGNIWAQSFTGSFSGSAAAPGLNTQVIFNSSGSLAASSGFVFTGANVGIGTTSPPQKLQVVDSTTFTSINVYNNRGSSGGTSSIMLGLNDGAFVTNDAARMEARVVGNPNSALDFKVYGSSLNTIMTLLGTGNVGIGTATPAAKLSVELSGAANQRLANFRNTGGNSFIEIQSSGTGAIGFWTAADNSFSIYQNSTAGTIGTSVLYVSSSTNVGIGTTAPGAKLTVRGGNIDVQESGYGLVTNELKLADYNTGIFTDGTNGNMTFSTYGGGTGNTFRWVTNVAGTNPHPSGGTTRMVMDKGGNVGIGTTTPTAKLDVVGSRVLISGDSASTGELSVYTGLFGSTASQRFLVSGSNIDVYALRVKGITGGNFNATIYASIDNTGNGYFAGSVGIGTTTPIYKLQTSGISNFGDGPFVISGGSNSTGYYDQSAGAYFHVPTMMIRRDQAATSAAEMSASLVLYNKNGTNNTGNKLVFAANETTTTSANPVATAAIVSQKVSGTDTGWASGNLKFLVKSTSAYTDVMTMLSNGNVGIGSATPGTTLDVVGNVRAQSFTGSFSGSSAAPGSNTNVIYNSSGVLAGSNNFIFNGTNVGIGTTSPTSRFEINNGSATTSAFYANIGNPSSTITLFEHSGSNTPVTFRLRKTGYSGAALNYGLLYLHMNDNTVGNGSALYFTLNDSLGNEHEYGGIGAVIGANTNGAENGHLYFMTSDAGTNRLEKMRILSNGNVGIGTITPITKLEVFSTAPIGDRTLPHNVLTLTAEQGNAPYSYFGGSILFKNRSYVSGIVESSRIRSVIYDDGAPNNFGGGIWFETTPTPGGSLTSSLVLNYLGNVGIGTTVPAHKLDVVGNVNIPGGNYYKGAGVNLIGSDGTSNYINAAASLYFSQGAGYAMRLDGNGNLGIATTSPAYKLDVSGSVAIRQNKYFTPYKSAYIFARGWGYNSVASSIVSIDGADVLNTGGRGLHLVIINAATLAFVSSTLYDTYGSTADSDNLATAIGNMTSAQVGVLVSADAWELNVTANLRSAALKVGLTKLGTYSIGGARRPYAAIFNGSSDDANATTKHSIERMESDDADAPYANITTYLTTDGTYASIDGALHMPNALYSSDSNVEEPVLVVTSGTNVGIGTTNPVYKLDVLGTSRIVNSTLPFYVYSSGSDWAQGVRIGDLSTNNGYMYLGYVSASKYGSLQAGDNDAYRNIYINHQAGNVGIGTTTAPVRLNVNGAINAGTDSATVGTIIIQDQYTSGHLTVFGTNQSSGGPMIGYAVYPSSSINTFASSTTITIERSAFVMDSEFRWYTGGAQALSLNAQATMTKRMSLSNAGALTIDNLAGTGDRIVGTNSSGVLSAITIGSGLSLSGGTLTATGGSAGTVTGGGANSQVSYWTSASNITGSTYFTYDATNYRIGIGTTTAPTYALDAYGAGAVIRAESNGSYVDIALKNTSTTSYIQASTTNMHFFVNGGSTSDIVLSLDGTNDRVGIGITTPSYRLHVSGTAYINNYKSTGAGEALIVEGSGDVRLTNGGSIFWGAYSYASSTYIQAYDDQDGIYFYSNGTFSTFINSTGVGIGTSTPQSKLQIVNNVSGGGFASYGSYQILLYQAGSAANSYGIGIESNTMMFNSDNYYKFYVDNVAKVYIDNTGTITAAGDLIAYGSPSDITLKTNVKPLAGALEKITKLQGVSFTWKDSEQTKMTGLKDDIGFIAQEVKEILPELVRENDNGLLSLRDKGIVPYLVEAIKEQQKQIDELRYLLKKQ